MLLKKKCNNLDEYSLHHSKSTLSKRIYEISYWICINVKHIKPNYSQLAATKKIKIFSDLYSLRILIDDPGIRARWYVTIRSEPRIRSGLLARRGEGGECTDESAKIGRWDLRCLCSIRLLRVPSMICIWGDAEIAFRIRSLDAVASERVVYISWFAGLSNFFQVSERSRTTVENRIFFWNIPE